MTDSENDNLENNDDNLDDDNEEEDNNLDNNKNKYDDKFKCYNYDDNTMHTMYLKNSEIDKVKIDKVTDYYNLFVSMLKTEDKFLHTREHFWVLGIDEAGYSVCVYVVTLGYPNFFNVAPTRLFKTALHHDSVKIIIAQSKPDAETLGVTPTDLDLTNIVYHKSTILGLELYDHIIISNSSINSKTPLYCSHLENGIMYFVQNDMTYKSYNDIKPELDKAKKEEVDDALIEGEAKGIDKGKVIGEKIGASKEKIEMAKKLLKRNVDIDIILETTGFTIEEIKILKKDMGLPS